MKTRILYTIISFLLLLSCTTSRTTVSNTTDLSKYKYASLTDVMNYNGAASLMDIEVKIYDALENTRLEIIGDKRIDELSPEQKEQLLLVRFSATSNDEESVVSVNFVDYMTGKPVASCRGAYQLGLSRNMDMDGAIKKVTKQISMCTKLFNALPHEL